MALRTHVGFVQSLATAAFCLPEMPNKKVEPNATVELHEKDSMSIVPISAA